MAKKKSSTSITVSFEKGKVRNVQGSGTPEEISGAVRFAELFRAEALRQAEDPKPSKEA